ncbi:MAG: hypothetical protein GF418_07000 [Chitinivibrionales bacterium]|nr:hypothetical protein [Chitinivibrionales bacterium]MBD3395358.1 hypothetical protein [Chitinivibrionales bacterium]
MLHAGIPQPARPGIRILANGMKRRTRLPGPLRLAQRLIGAALLLVIGIIAAGFIPFSNPGLVEKTEAILVRSGLDTCAVQGMGLSLWRGAVLTNVRCVKRFPGGGSLEIKAPRAGVSFRLLYILMHRKTFAGVLDQFFPSRRGVPLSARRGRERGSRDYGEAAVLPGIRAVSLEGATCRMSSAGETPAELHGLDLRAAIRAKLPVHIGIRVRGDTLAWGVWRIINPDVKAHYEDRQITVRKIGGAVYGGKLSGKCAIAAHRGVLLRGALAIKNVDLAEMYGASPGRDGTLSGTGDLSMTFSQCPLDADSLEGRGAFVLRRVTADRIPVLSSIVISLTVPQLSRLRFNSITGGISLENGIAMCPEVTGSGHPLDLDATGWVIENGYFEFDVTGTLESKYEDTLGSLAWNSLLPAENDRRMFSCRVTGTFDNPRVRLDSRITRRAMRNVFRNIGRDIRSAFKR